MGAVLSRGGPENAHEGRLGGVLRVLRRLAPFQRGLYEDYVSNFWCATNPIFRWRRMATRAAAQTGARGSRSPPFAPSVAHQIARPSAEGFVWCLANTAWVFSCSVSRRTKSALLPLLPVTLLSLRAPELVAWLPPIVCFSMWPLLRKDGLAVAYVASVAVFCALVGGGAPGKKADEEAVRFRAHRGTIRVATTGGIATAAAAHLAAATIPPPRAYPHLHDLIFSVLSFAAFAGAAAASNWRQWKTPAEPRGRGRARNESARRVTRCGDGK